MRLAPGNLPEVLGATYTFDGSYVNKTPRITVKPEPGTFVLRITETELSDTAFYYCEEYADLQTTFLNVTFLRVQGKCGSIQFFLYAMFNYKKFVFCKLEASYLIYSI